MIWPKDDKIVSFVEITEPIREAILFAYTIKRKNKNRSIPWNGLDIGEDEKCTCFSPKDQFHLDNLRYSEDEQGRDALDEILGLAVRLGIEQGRRIFKNSIEYTCMKIRLDLLKK